MGLIGANGFWWWKMHEWQRELELNATEGREGRAGGR